MITRNELQEVAIEYRKRFENRKIVDAHIQDAFIAGGLWFRNKGIAEVESGQSTQSDAGKQSGEHPTTTHLNHY